MGRDDAGTKGRDAQGDAGEESFGTDDTGDRRARERYQSHGGSRCVPGSSQVQGRPRRGQGPVRQDDAGRKGRHEEERAGEEVVGTDAGGTDVGSWTIGPIRTPELVASGVVAERQGPLVSAFFVNDTDTRTQHRLRTSWARAAGGKFRGRVSRSRLCFR